LDQKGKHSVKKSKLGSLAGRHSTLVNFVSGADSPFDPRISKNNRSHGGQAQRGAKKVPPLALAKGSAFSRKKKKRSKEKKLSSRHREPHSKPKEDKPD